MPKIKFEKVLSCSSEHPNHPASNLLLEPAKGIKWNTNQTEADVAEVILQLEAPCKIKNINIGNSHSANVSVLVKNSMRNGDDFKTVLPVVTLMSPIESRNSEKAEQVKTFLMDDLDQSVSKTNYWDVIKVVCTQPFNKQVNYGLAFLSIFGEKLQNNDDRIDSKKVTAPVSKTETSPRMLGKFKFREESPEDDELKGVSLINKWKNERQGPKLVTPPSKPKPAPKVASRNRSSLLYDDDSDTEDKNERVKHSAKKLKLQEIEKNESKRKADGEKLEIKKKRTKNFSEFLNEINDEKPEPKQAIVVPTTLKPDAIKIVKKDDKEASSSLNKPTTSHTTKFNPSQEKTGKETERKMEMSQKASSSSNSLSKRNVTTKPFNKLFEGVTIVISGIQNPDRADIRKQAMEMGAKYSGDWNNRCTHLICAFKNTPKYREVHGKGKIITKDWILKSYSKKRRLPWRRFALDDNELDQDESEEEILEERCVSPKPVAESSTKSKKESHQDILDMYDLNYDMPENADRKDDEVYDRSTDDDDNSRDSLTKKTRKLFDRKSFYLHINISMDDIKKLEEIVGKHNGNIIKDMHAADYVISVERLKAIDLGINGCIVDPKWVFECNEMESVVPTASFSMKEE